MTENVKKNRIVWIDVLRAIAIVLVLTAHYDGYGLSKLATLCCVQMFFFLSGMFAYGDKHTLGGYIIKQAQTIMLPYAVFAAINIVFHRIFNPGTTAAEMLNFAQGFLLARRNGVMVAAMWFLPCLFITSIIYKILATVLKKHRYIVPVCLVISAVFKIYLEDPVYVFSLNQGLKYIIYIALGGAAYPYLKNISIEKIVKADVKYKVIVFAVAAASIVYMGILARRGYVFWPKSVFGLALVYFINVVMCFVFFTMLAMILSPVKPLSWIGQNTLGYCCLENIDRALLNTAMAIFGFGFAPVGGVKVFVHTVLSMCVGTVIILIINKICPVILGKAKPKQKNEGKILYKKNDK